MSPSGSGRTAEGSGGECAAPGLSAEHLSASSSCGSAWSGGGACEVGDALRGNWAPEPQSSWSTLTHKPAGVALLPKGLLSGRRVSSGALMAGPWHSCSSFSQADSLKCPDNFHNDLRSPSDKRLLRFSAVPSRQVSFHCEDGQNKARLSWFVKWQLHKR